MKTITPTVSQLRILATMRGQQWFMKPDSIQSFALSAMEASEKINAVSFEFEDFYELRPEAKMNGEIGHAWVQGALIDSCPAIYEKLGMVTRYETIGNELSDLVAKGAKAIVLHFNSPGGTVSGVIEGAHSILDCPVPIVAHAHGLMCSAAYYLAAGCTEIIANPSAIVGNIGTILSWADCTEFWKNAGIEFKAMTNEGADLKSTFHLEPDATQLAFLQEEINRSGSEFRAHVSSNREVDDEVWRAGWYSGEKAGQLGLIDGIGSASDAEELAQSLANG